MLLKLQICFILEISRKTEWKKSIFIPQFMSNKIKMRTQRMQSGVNTHFEGHSLIYWSSKNMFVTFQVGKVFCGSKKLQCKKQQQQLCRIQMLSFCSLMNLALDTVGFITKCEV